MRQIGLPSLDLAKLIVHEMKIPIPPEQFIVEAKAILKTTFATAQLLPGVEALVRHLHQHCIPMAVATSSHKDVYDIKTANHKDLFSLFNHVITGDSPGVVRGKPAPDIYQVILCLDVVM